MLSDRPDLATMPTPENDIDANHLGRMRLQFLVSQHASIVTQTQFADAKAAALMTLLGLLALNGPVKLGEVSLVNLDAILLFLINLSAILCCFWSIVPRYPDAALRERIRRSERFSWPSLVANGHEPLEYAASVGGAEGQDLIQSMSLANTAAAGVLLRKFRALRTAFWIAVVYLAAIVAYVFGLVLLGRG